MHACNAACMHAYNAVCMHASCCCVCVASTLCINQFSLHAVMLTRAKLLRSKLPGPDMSTSPSILAQAEDVRSSHPKSVQEFDVIPDVMDYISHLGVTPKRFKPVDYPRQYVRFCIAIWVCIRLLLLHSCCWHMHFTLCSVAHCSPGLLCRRLVQWTIISVVNVFGACWCVLLATHRQVSQLYAACCKRGSWGAAMGVCNC